ncbi:hypothetical protein [Deinococcus sp. LM3]|uniref:hypothetical protein n=1 Tax=Deinococcus sp. LM3 TaxID=1938608 RepID=UPI001F0B5580|nr:hypothetical protein [Deinococcus sp. LM3]
MNVLLLAVIWRGVAIPLLYELLPHGGGSHTEIRHTLMDDALCLLSVADIRVLYADREFVGYNWIQGLACLGIPICVRLRSDTLMDDWTAKDWLSRLQTGTAGLLVEDTLVYGQPMNVVLTHTRDGEALIIASNAGAVTTIQKRYRRRFLIETGQHDYGDTSRTFCVFIIEVALSIHRWWYRAPTGPALKAWSRRTSASSAQRHQLPPRFDCLPFTTPRRSHVYNVTAGISSA